MLDPVFVDTSEGRAVVADSLKPPVQKVLEKVTIEEPVTDKKEIKNKPKGKIKTEEVSDESNVNPEDAEIEVKKGK